MVPHPAPDETLLRAVDRVGSYAAQRQQYGLTKLLHLYWLRELCGRWPGSRTEPQRLQIHACDFGVARGSAGIAAINWEARIFGKVFGRPPETCAKVVARSCVPRDGSHGKLFLDYDIIPCVHPRLT